MSRRPGLSWTIDDTDRVDRARLTRKQLKAFLLVHKHLNEYRESFDSKELGELMDPMGIFSHQQMHNKTWWMLHALEKKGYIKRLPRKEPVFISIGLHLDVHRRLKKLCRSSKETHNEVIRRALDSLDSHTEKETIA